MRGESVRCFFSRLTPRPVVWLAGKIDVLEFQAALGFTNSTFAVRIFRALDEDGSDSLEFDEFVRGFYLLSTRASKTDKIAFTFKIYDVNGDGDIDKGELLQLLTDVVRAGTEVGLDSVCATHHESSR